MIFIDSFYFFNEKLYNSYHKLREDGLITTMVNKLYEFPNSPSGGKKMIKVILRSFCVMASNILLGVTLAKIKGIFNKYKLLTSIIKYISLIICVFFLYLAEMLNEYVVVEEINSISVNLVSGIKIFKNFN